MPFTRGRGPRDPDLPWDVRQLHDDPDSRASREAVLADLERGVSSVWLHVGDDGIAAEDVAEVLTDVMVDLAPVTVSSWTDQSAAAAALVAAWEAKGVDPAVVAPQPPVDAEVLELVRAGRKIQAIKRYREVTGAGLREAKEAVDDIERGDPGTAGSTGPWLS